MQEVLFEYTEVFVEPTGGDDLWSVTPATDVERRLGLRGRLRPWQVTALQTWFTQGRNGVVEAVTGTGKTDLGLAAIADARKRGVPTLVLVPDSAAVEHWRNAVAVEFPDVVVGVPDRSRALALNQQIVIATAAGVGKRPLTAFHSRGLVIVDEVQRFLVTDLTDTVFPRRELTERLALTASFEWAAPGVERVLTPYFGARIEGCDYRRAADEGILPRPAVVTVGVSFSMDERREYETCANRIQRAEKNLREIGIDLGAGVLETAREIEAGSLVGEVGFLAKELLDAHEARRSVLGRCSAKAAAVAKISVGLEGLGCVVFTTDSDMSVAVAKAVRGTGRAAVDIPDRSDATSAIGLFERGKATVLATSRLLDEGVAVPTAQVGIVTAPARSRGQMLQRMGRIVQDGRRGAMVVVYVNGTPEDPDVGMPEDVHCGPLFGIAELQKDLTPVEAGQFLSGWCSGDVADVISPVESAAQAPEDVERESWDPRDAIRDIFDEYSGVLTWDELREVLPDIEVENVLMHGLDGVTWMRVGDHLVGSYQAEEGDIAERIVELETLADAHEADIDADRTAGELRSEWRGAAKRLGGLAVRRAETLWQALGGRIRREPAPGRPAGEPPTRVVDFGVPTSETEEPGRSSNSDQAAALVIDRIRQHGGRAEQLADRRLAVTGTTGSSYTARVLDATAGAWRIDWDDHELTDSVGRHEVIVFVDRQDGAPVFYVVPSATFAKRLKSVRKAWLRAGNRPGGAGWVGVERFVVNDRLDRWDLLGIGEATAVEHEGGPQPEPTPEVVLPPAEEAVPELVWSDRGELRVSIDIEDNHIIGFFDPVTSELRIALAQGAPEFVDKKFRNPAAAAGAVKSKIAGRTVFGIGYQDWIVDEKCRLNLATHLAGR
ncbi:DEAD/DEAH box helicase family protein [Tsukamurella tyrosinosolvens]|uniref:DEAD/DEAH box helicase n=1 Tax=Tsukamurella tyrosinosolvens TaxID=57704 RepID=UPI0014773CE7